MAKENSRELKMQIIFKQHPAVKEFHVTSDDQAFFQPADAKNHATTLADKEVEIVKRGDVLKKVLIDEPKGESTPAKAADKKADESKADPAKEERKALFARIEELGCTAAKTLGTAKLKEKIAELEAAKAESEKQNAEGAANGEGAGE
jgi:hypothetical protein